jgi:DNA-binding IclR family transcriptional regulator
MAVPGENAVTPQANLRPVVVPAEQPMKKRLARPRRVAMGGARPASPRPPALPRRADDPTADDAGVAGPSARAAGADVGGAYAVPAVDKALDILELLGEASPGMSLTGIADALGRTKQEIYRVLVRLQDRGYLVRDEAQVYRLSTKLFEIGSRNAGTQFLTARAMPHMERLSRRLRESCHLTIVVQNHMLVVTRAEGNADVMLAVRIGATFGLHERVSGLVALAMLPEHRRREYWRQSGEPDAAVVACEARLDRIRRQGYAHDDSPIVVGVKDCAAPVLDAAAGLLGVLCVSHLCRRDDPDEHADIVAAVVATAGDIALEFGPAPIRAGDDVDAIRGATP